MRRGKARGKRTVVGRGAAPVPAPGRCERMRGRSRRAACRAAGCALLAVGLLAQVGCGTVWVNKRVDPLVHWSEQRVLRERVLGSARIRTEAHADGLGWTVEVWEPVERVTAGVGQRRITGRPYRVMPVISWLVAAMGCGLLVPAGAIGVPLYVLFGGAAVVTRDYVPALLDGCVYPLIGLLPREPGRFTDTTEWEPVEGSEHREEAARPVTEAEVGVRAAGLPWIRYPVEPDGRRSVRIERVPLGVEDRVEAVELGVWVRGAERRTWTEPIGAAAWARVANEPRVPREAWPARVAVGVWGWEGLPAAVRERSERRLVEEVARVVHPRGGRVLWLSSLARPVLDAERRRQYAGGVDEREQVSLGREAGATILVRPVARPAGGLWQVGVDVLAVETGAVWTAVSWEVPERALAAAAEAVNARVVRVLAQAPAQDR